MIGFFDSGLGGLTILQEVMSSRPGSYMYLGDNARAPYGQRSNEEVTRFTIEGVRWLIDQGCDLVILACNTASANALRTIQQAWLPQYASNARVLGILVPTVEAITGVSWYAETSRQEAPSILIFATPSTVSSQAYEREISKRLPKAQIFSHACADLVSLIEANASKETLDACVKKHVQTALVHASHPDVVLLGCTHYALVEDLFKKHLPSEVVILAQPKIISGALQNYVAKHVLNEAHTSESVQFFTTGDSELVARASQRFFPEIIKYKHIDLN